ncbi:putative acetyl xylan esterase (Axe1) [Aspergillus thermomutatus]|uniref:Carbohydrate esterase n=1 Tax=Aspergillus thermomutatus TaxID=41047 RepID=A0A397H5P8_ASPTH|nr:carbohydrate esterase [Aspergillus thermomutatus]RHZ58382.1 carbohydrate esterase [Aspergillus thermomutatus]
MLFTAVTLALLGQALAGPVDLEERQSSCPNIHVFGARETTAPAGYGSSSTVVNLILNAYPGSTSEAISYPACGGQSSCGGVSYANSVVAGINAVVSAVNSFNQKCPSTQLVLVGYSQGGQIMDDALCGGGDPNQGYTNTAVPLSASAVNMIKAAIFMGDPRFIAGLSYEVGTCKAAGFDPRPAGFSCPSASKIQSYCDAADPYCCNGNDANTHQGYGTEYGQAALTFVKSKLSSSSSGGGGSGGSGGSTGTVAHYGQCGGQGWTGATSCQSPYTCTVISQWYSQCL